MMTAIAPTLVELALSLAALAGLWSLYGLIAARGAHGPLNRRFLFGLRVTMLLFAGRALTVLTGVEAFRVLVLLAAALIPVAVLILAEGLLRRHAPKAGKVWIGAGTLVFGALAFLPDRFGQAGLWALLAFQLSGLALAGGLVVRRDVSSLTPAENRAAVRLGLSLLLIMPLAALDFVAPVLGLPLQPSGLAVLFLCWLAIGLGQPGAGHRQSLAGFARAVAVGLMLTALTALATGGDLTEAALLGAAILAAVIVVAIWNEAARQKEDAEGRSLLAHIAHGPDDAARFLSDLRAHPLVEGAIVLTGRDIAGIGALPEGLFSDGPVLRRGGAGLAGDAADYADHLFERYAATHILCLRRDPPELLALAMPDLAASSRTELELAAVARVAALLSERGS